MEERISVHFSFKKEQEKEKGKRKRKTFKLVPYLIKKGKSLRTTLFILM